MNAGRLVSETLRALLAPRRLVPTLLVGAALTSAEVQFDRDPRGVWVAVTMVVACALTAPIAWRLLLEKAETPARQLVGTLAFGALGALVLWTTGPLLSHALHLTLFFLARASSFLICLSFFIVGGWGLGRDISLESSLHRERARAELLSREAERAQLLALRSNLDPHFLFNTLNAIAEWCRQDGEVAERAILQLSGMLRTILDGVQAPTWSLDRELSLVRALFEMHQLRDPERFAVQWSLPRPLPALRLPPLLLLGLAENAVKHGPAQGHRGVIRLQLQLQLNDDGVHVVLTNPGPYAGPREGSSGLPTLRKRLALAYGTRARLEIGPQGSDTRVQLWLPGEPNVRWVA